MLVLDPSKQPVSGETVGINQVREEDRVFFLVVILIEELMTFEMIVSFEKKN